MTNYNRFATDDHRSILIEVNKHIKNNTRPEGGVIEKGSIGEAKFPKCQCEDSKYRIATKLNKGGSYMIRAQCKKCKKAGSQNIKWSSLPREVIVKAIHRYKTYSGPISSDFKLNEWK